MNKKDPVDVIKALTGPTRKATQLADGSWRIDVTPPPLFNLPTQSVTLTAAQYERYLLWRQRRMLIQEALPDLNDDQREILISGLADNDFKKFAE